MRLDVDTFIRLSERKNPTARIWKYRMEYCPEFKRTVEFGFNVAEEEVRRFLATEEGLDPKELVVWPVFATEPAGRPGYGVCPICKAPGMKRERRPDGNDTCRDGHVYPSKNAIYR